MIPIANGSEGELRERNLGELPHAAVQGFFTRVMGNHAAEWRVRAYPELRLQISAERYRVPDVRVRRWDDPAEAIVRTAPLLCIEVLSRDERASDLQEKIDDYLRMGVAMVWVIDPRLRTAFMADVADGRSAWKS